VFSDVLRLKIFGALLIFLQRGKKLQLIAWNFCFACAVNSFLP
jgi:hypothetical protein